MSAAPLVPNKSNFTFTAEWSARRESAWSEFNRVRPYRVAADQFCADSTWRNLPARLNTIARFLTEWQQQDQTSTSSEKQRIVTAAVMYAAPDSLVDQLESICRASIDQKIRQTVDEEDDDDDNLMQDGIPDFFTSIETLGWFDTLLRQPLHQAVRHVVGKIVEETVRGEWETPDLFSRVQSQCQAVRFWLEDAKCASIELESMAARLFCEFRMKELFEIITDYPDSHVACEELGALLKRCDLLAELCRVLRETLVRRVTHPGADTASIILVYIHTIKVLHVLDGHRWLAAVTQPVRTYLRQRPDTVRCILTSLTTGDLYEELRRPDAKLLENVVSDSDDEEEEPTMEWEPPPSITNRYTFLENVDGSSSKSSDILAMLVSIYGSKQLFVQEYRLMLADKLLQATDYKTDEQVHTLELLKLRFGEASMRSPEVMIKDMDDSKRTNALLHGVLGKRTVDAVMVSHMFWPPLQKKETLQHHSRIQTELDEFGAAYGKLKNPRQLVWMNQLGSVELDLDITTESGKMETRSFTCTPLQATLILHFDDRPEWTLPDLCNETGIPEHILPKRMAWWIRQRVIVSVTNPGVPGTVYRLASTMGEQPIISPSLDLDDDENDQALSIAAEEEEAMELFESYIFGMLTNMGQLPLQRIHSLLQTFVTGSDVRYDKTAAQLSVFLQRLVRQEKLECGPDGLYKLFTK